MIYIILEYLNNLPTIHFLSTSKNEALDEFKKLRVGSNSLSYSFEMRDEKTQKQTQLAYVNKYGVYKAVS